MQGEVSLHFLICQTCRTQGKKKHTKKKHSPTAALSQKIWKINLGDANIDRTEGKQNGANVKGAQCSQQSPKQMRTKGHLFLATPRWERQRRQQQRSGSSYSWHPRQLASVYCKAVSPGRGASNRGNGIKEDSIVLNRQLCSWELAKCCCLLSLLSGNKAICQTIVGGKLFFNTPTGVWAAVTTR